MDANQLYKTLKGEFRNLIEEYRLNDSEIDVSMVSLSPQEAIGDTKRKDFPILVGKEVMVQARYKDSFGQAFTNAPSIFHGSLNQVLEMDILENLYERGIFIATLNAIMAHLKLADKTVHCKNEEPEECGMKSIEFIKEQYLNPKIGIIGYQPALIENLSKVFEVRVLDLNPDNIGKHKYDVKIEDGKLDFDNVISWADIILCTGSTLCNGSIVNFLNLEKEVVFYGTTISAAAKIFNLKRMCLCSI